MIFNIPEKKKDGSLEYKRFQKQKFYLDALKEAGEHDALFAVAYKGMTNNIEQIASEFENTRKAKSSDFVGINVDGIALESSKGYLEWWEDFRREIVPKKKDTQQKRCFITGELAEPVKTVPPVQGLIAVGGHTKGDSFICFDKDAYRSYGFEKAANAAVSEEAVTAVNAALKELMNGAPVLAGAKHIHWFSKKTENDVTKLPDFGLGVDEQAEDESDKIERDELRVRKMFDALNTGTLPPMPENRYYMMSLSGVNGRVMIRSYDEGTYDELCDNLRMWYEDIAIFEEGYGYRYPKLFGIYSRLIKHTTDNKKLGEKIEKELSGISAQIQYAVYHGTPLPDAVAVKALAYIRSDMFGNPDDTKKQMMIPDKTACQILKAWHNRKYRMEDDQIMDKLNQDSPSAAYQTGRLMAILIWVTLPEWILRICTDT